MVATKRHCGLIAMVTVGDEQLLILHQFHDARDWQELPHPMERVDLAEWIAVQHEDGLEMRMGVLEQLHAILLRTRQRLLMTKHDACGVLLHLPEREEALAYQPLASVWHDELLEVREHSRLGI